MGESPRDCKASPLEAGKCAENLDGSGFQQNLKNSKKKEVRC